MLTMKENTKLSRMISHLSEEFAHLRDAIADESIGLICAPINVTNTDFLLVTCHDGAVQYFWMYESYALEIDHKEAQFTWDVWTKRARPFPTVNEFRSMELTGGIK